jgi:hypothetical protein
MHVGGLRSDTLILRRSADAVGEADVPVPLGLIDQLDVSRGWPTF